MSTGIPISSDGRLQILSNLRSGAAYRVTFPTHEVTIDASVPIGTGTGAVVFALRTDASTHSLPDGWRQLPFPAERPVYWFPLFGTAIFAGTAPGGVVTSEPWTALSRELGTGVVVLSTFLPPATLEGLARLIGPMNSILFFKCE